MRTKSHFIDGPAAGVSLELSRAPKLLRVAKCGDQFRALEKLDDEPFDLELCSVYVGRSSTWKEYEGGESSDYELMIPQPFDHEIRETDDWRAWCRETEYAADYLDEVPK